MKQDCILKSPNCFTVRLADTFFRASNLRMQMVRYPRANTQRSREEICIYRTTSFFSVERNILRASGYHRSGL